jgi:hypothetical protein
MIELKSMAIAMPEVAGHPNRAAFRGVLTMVDVPSQRPPSGAKGHLVVLTRKAAEAALPSLLGMGVDYAPSFDRHDVRCKVGVITRAEIVGRNVELGGYLFARDFPEIVQEIGKAKLSDTRHPLHTMRAEGMSSWAEESAPRRHEEAQLREGRSLKLSLRTVAAQLLRLTDALRGESKLPRPHKTISTISATTETGSGSSELGMSYEVTEVELADRRAAVWKLERVTFTGAAILRRDKAAYKDTWIALST